MNTTMKCAALICAIFLAASLAGCTTPQGGTRPALEYRVEWLSAATLQEDLNRLGKEGWAVVTTSRMPDSSLREVILSRPMR